MSRPLQMEDNWRCLYCPFLYPSTVIYLGVWDLDVVETQWVFSKLNASAIISLIHLFSEPSEQCKQKHLGIPSKAVSSSHVPFASQGLCFRSLLNSRRSCLVYKAQVSSWLITSRKETNMVAEEPHSNHRFHALYTEHFIWDSFESHFILFYN